MWLKVRRLCGLIWKGIDFTHKTKRSISTLPINKILLEDFKVLKNEDSKIHGFNDNYFVAGNVFPISSNALADRKNRNCNLAGVPQIRIHDFRHSYTSFLINNSANVTVVAKYLGHTPILTYS